MCLVQDAYGPAVIGPMQSRFEKGLCRFPAECFAPRVHTLSHLATLASGEAEVCIPVVVYISYR